MAWGFFPPGKLTLAWDGAVGGSGGLSVRASWFKEEQPLIANHRIDRNDL
jgi:hypothetical protein